MVPPPSPFRVVFRSFRGIEFDVRKSDEVFNEREFDFEYVSRIFQNYVLERKDTRHKDEVRYQAIGEISGEVYFVVYVVRSGVCRIITAWLAQRYERELWHDFTR